MASVQLYFPISIYLPFGETKNLEMSVKVLKNTFNKYIEKKGHLFTSNNSILCVVNKNANLNPIINEVVKIHEGCNKLKTSGHNTQHGSSSRIERR